MSSEFIDTASNSTDDPEYLFVETRSDGAWLEITRDGKTLGIELAPEQVIKLRRALADVEP